jgi:SulP family sulfate permease
MEFAGALGDLGTFVPIFISLVAINGLNPTIILLTVGLLYIFCGFYYKLPIPVQPLKAIAAIAIATGLSASVISASGILLGIILLLLAITGAVNFLSRIFPLPIVRGIQLGVGLLLIRTSWILITSPININGEIGFLDKKILFDLVVLFGGIIIMLIFLRNKHFPSTASMLGFGIIISTINGQANGLPIQFFHIQRLNLLIPDFNDFTKAFFLLVIPQLPLTLGNAIIATKDVAKKYFGKQAKRVTEKNLSLSIGIANIIAGLTCSMPVCHGSGGLTAHYSFGARTGGACIIIGSIFLFLSLIFGEGIVNVFKLIPHSIFGIMLFYVGLRHAYLVTDLKGKKELLISFIVGIISLLTGNLAIGFGLGILLLYSSQIIQKNIDLRKVKIIIDK